MKMISLLIIAFVSIVGCNGNDTAQMTDETETVSANSALNNQTTSVDTGVESTIGFVQWGSTPATAEEDEDEKKANYGKIVDD